jgi:hypothetical protein
MRWKLRPCLKTRRICPSEKNVKEENNNGRDEIWVKRGIDKEMKQKEKTHKNFLLDIGNAHECK